RFACYARNTNVALITWGESWGKTEEEWASPDRLRYELSSDGGEVIDVDGPSDPPLFSIHLFCAHLVRDLADRGRLDLAEANRLLGGWGLALMGAKTCPAPGSGCKADSDN